jgi:hypothetical protein
MPMVKGARQGREKRFLFCELLNMMVNRLYLTVLSYAAVERLDFLRKENVWAGIKPVMIRPRESVVDFTF